MKTLKVLVCALFVLCGGLVFAACGEKQDFDVSKISIGSMDEFIYDGTNHAIAIEYEGVNANITYSLEENKNVFLPLSQLPSKDVGTYNVYYKLSAKGYNDYVSSGTLQYSVLPREFEIIINDFNWVKNDAVESLQFGYTTVGDVANEDLGLEFHISDDFNVETAQYGEEYELTCSISNSNYILIAQPASFIVKNNVDLINAEGEVIGYYPSIQSALNNAQDGQTLVLNKNIAIGETINIEKSVVIDGQGKYTIFASQNFDSDNEKDVASMFLLNNDNSEITLKNVTLNCSEVVRGVSAFKGNVNIDGATITNGNQTDGWRSGGVYITSKATFNMTSGTIVGNNANDTEYTKYCADLWIGANAQGLVNSSITGGVVGNVFVNSNSYSATDAGKFTLDGGSIENIYVEYDAGFGATFEYVTGKVNNLMVSLINKDGNYWGVYEKLTPVEGRTYHGGQLVYTEDNLNSAVENNIHFEGENISDIDDYITYGNDYIFENCTFTGSVNTNKYVGIVFNNCTFNGDDNASNLQLSSVKRLVVNYCKFNGKTNGIAVDIALIDTNCDDIKITNCTFNSSSEEDEDVAISVKAIKSKTNYQADGTLNSLVIGGNSFTNTNNTIYIGDDPVGSNTSANLFSGNFDVLVSKNLTDVTIYNKFKDDKYVAEPSIETVTAGRTYDSTNVD